MPLMVLVPTIYMIRLFTETKRESCIPYHGRTCKTRSLVSGKSKGEGYEEYCEHEVLSTHGYDCTGR